jgi:hypothetical protein
MTDPAAARDADGAFIDQYGIRRPPNGYTLDLYDHLKRSIRDLPHEIAKCRSIIEGQQGYLDLLEKTLDEDTKTLAWMMAHQSDEIAEIEAHREKVRQLIRQGKR